MTYFLLVSRSVFATNYETLTRAYTVYGQALPLHAEEVVPLDEAAAIEDLLSHMTNYFKTFTDNGQATLRGVHPKSHGSLRGIMKVSSNIHPDDQVGIFASPGKIYEIEARFSNGNPRPQEDDSLPDSRGFGLKVLGIEGKPLLKGISGTSHNAQDFTMNSSPTFFADTAETYANFMKIGLLETQSFQDAATKHVIDLFKSFRPLLATRVLNAFKEIQNVEATNPLALDYFSITAFSHGEGSAAPIVKYALKPCDGTWVDDVDPHDKSFLRHNLIRYISSKPACFRFMVQDYMGGFSVEDPTRSWDEKLSPFREIARIEFPPQELVPDAIAERWVINPWNTLPAHQPLGGINRLRLAAYLFSIEMRQKTNPQPHPQPQ